MRPFVIVMAIPDLGSRSGLRWVFVWVYPMVFLMHKLHFQDCMLHIMYLTYFEWVYKVQCVQVWKEWSRLNYIYLVKDHKCGRVSWLHTCVLPLSKRGLFHPIQPVMHSIMTFSDPYFCSTRILGQGVGTVVMGLSTYSIVVYKDYRSIYLNTLLITSSYVTVCDDKTNTSMNHTLTNRVKICGIWPTLHNRCVYVLRTRNTCNVAHLHVEVYFLYT